MADEDIQQAVDAQDAPSTIPQDNRLAPLLQQVRSTIQPNEDGSTWADPALAAIQQDSNATMVADSNQAAGNRFMQNMQSLKDELVGIAQADPTRANLALRLTPRLVAPMLASTGMSDEDGEAAHQSIVGHIQQEIARAAVMRMADIHGDGARQMLDELSPYLSDEARAPLPGYINTLQAARTADDAARQQSMSANAARQSGIAAYQFGSTLLDPRTETASIPPNFVQTLARNGALQTPDKSALMGAFSRLTGQGDPAESNPYAVRQLLSGISDPRTQVGTGDIYDHVGSDVKLADAVMLHGMNLQRTPDGMGAVRQLGSLLDNAQDMLAPGTDRAGNVAFSRFVNWLLPSYRRTGPSGLNPGSDNYLFNGLSLDNFRPNHADAVPQVGPANRPSLEQIFAGVEPEGFGGKIDRLRALEQENNAPVAPPSGKFFQRKLEESQPKENG